MSDSDRFRLYYLTNYWGDGESESGFSARYSETVTIRNLLTALLTLQPNLRVIDLGCGRCHWVREVIPASARYMGLDIVSEVIDKNRKDLASRGFEFREADVRRDPLPQGDLILARDLMGHLSPDDVRRVVKNIKASGAAVLIATNFRGSTAGSRWESGNHCSYDLETNDFGLGRSWLFVPEIESVTRSKPLVKGLGIWRVGRATGLDSSMDQVVGSICESNRLDFPNASPNRSSSRSKMDSSALFADGRGRAFLSKAPVEAYPNSPETDPCESDTTFVYPQLVAVGEIERRLTKTDTITVPPESPGLVLGRQAIVKIPSASGAAGFGVVADTLAPNSGAEIVHGLLSRHGLLRSKALVCRQLIVSIPRPDPLYLLAYPLAPMLQFWPALNFLAVNGRARVLVVGSDSFALLAARYLQSSGVSVVLAGAPRKDGELAELTDRADLRYESLDTLDGEWNLALVTPGYRSAFAERQTKVRFGTAVYYSHQLDPIRHTKNNADVMKVGIVDKPSLSAAIEYLQEASDPDWLRDLLLPSVGLVEYDFALFPRVPIRTGVIRLY